MKSLTIFVTLLVSRIAGLSLDEIHSSSKTFKTISDNNKDKSLKTAIDTIRRRRQEYPIAQSYGSHSLPLIYYERLYDQMGDQMGDQPIVNLLGRKQIDSEYLEDAFDKDLLSTELALKLSQLLESNDRKESNVGHRVYNKINKKKKRSTSKQNSYFNEINDRKIPKSVKSVNRHKFNSIKTLTKRKSSRRVLNDHFNIEENPHSVIPNNLRIKPTKSSLKSRVKSNKRVGNKLKAKEVRKKIRKRKVELTATTDTSLGVNRFTNKSNKKDLKTTDKNIVSELNEILSEENKTETKVEKHIKNLNSSESKGSEENSTKTVRKMTKRNDPNIDLLIENLNDGNTDKTDKNVVNEDIIVYPNIDDRETKDEIQTNNELNEWLRREFYENMAKTLATMRRKRSEDQNEDQNEDLINDEQFETMGDKIVAIDDSNEYNDNINDEEFKNFNKLIDDSDNFYVIETNDDENEDNKYANDDNNDSNDSEDSLNWTHLEEKNANIKSKRSVPSYFGDIEDNIESNDINSKRFTRVYNNLESIEDSLLSEALDLIQETAEKGSEREAKSQKISNRLDAAYDIEDMRTALDDLSNTFNKINSETDNYLNDGEETNGMEGTPTRYTSNLIDIHKKDSFLDDSRVESDDKCFEMEGLSSDCSSVGDLLPNSDLRFSLIESCNWHQLCYSCGEIYGLLSSDCDAGFLEASRLSCAGSPSCEAFARLILTPLRQSRVYYKSSVPQICYRYQCIKDFLFVSQNNNR